MRTTENLPGTTSATRTFDRRPNTVPTARSWTTQTYVGFGAAEETVGTCRLLISEVITNAVNYGEGAEYIVVVYPDLWIEVWDEASALPHRREQNDLLSEGGRGLELLEGLAPGFQVIPDLVRGGKCVRFQPKGWPE
ncbi:ATP-binding protein [Streptomyces sp. NPDC059080]|uniref:ATP-binding protein n=1 Tax=Streptomyces sp. NPDC059080 TaxID=3346718 RepID=UPI0036AAF196